jgi:hypothetical protein
MTDQTQDKTGEVEKPDDIEATIREAIAGADIGSSDVGQSQAAPALSADAGQAGARDTSQGKVKPVGANTGQGDGTGQPGDAAAASAGVPKAPNSWTAPMKEVFPTLPANVQAYISQRETDLNKKLTAQDEDRNFGKRIKEITAPYSAIMTAEGAQPEEAFKSFLNTAYILRTGNAQTKAQALRTIARQYNVDLGAPLQQGLPQHPEIAELRATVQELQRGRQAEIQQRQSQEESQVRGQVEAFSAADGHEHFEQVKPLMATLLRDGQAADLQDAYDKAIWATPEIRSTLTAAGIQAAQQKRVSSTQAQADAAKRAAVSVTGGPGGARPQGQQVQERSLEDEIRANMAAANSRVA